MNLRIDTESWKLEEDEETKQKTITGNYCIKNGQKTIASKSFNTRYNEMKIDFPASILAKIEEIDKEICHVIENFFES